MFATIFVQSDSSTIFFHSSSNDQEGYSVYVSTAIKENLYGHVPQIHTNIMAKKSRSCNYFIEIFKI